ncbi:PAS domain-containing protein [Neorhizobium huautlense]|uniref:PAS domain-containing protein n=1 Tax=Neorhizobium huautlense TaxID=67774 RepID=UPI000CF9E605|nr:PAS domain-containing protein [Neorhizobium huautlense]
MRNQATRAVFDYWINLKGDRAAPLRTEIDPTALRHLLPHLFIAAMDERGVLAFRLAGTRICDLFGYELRGMAFNQIWFGAEQPQPLYIAQNVIRHEQPALVDLVAVTADARQAYEMLLLPLRSTDGRESDRLFGALLPRGAPFPAVALPVDGLEMESWTFLTGGASHFGVPVTVDQKGPLRAFPQQPASGLPAQGRKF